MLYDCRVQSEPVDIGYVHVDIIAKLVHHELALIIVCSMLSLRRSQGSEN